MITYREFSCPLRLAIAAPWCLLLGIVGMAASSDFGQLLLDITTHQPTTPVSLSGPNWTGTLDAARLPADPTVGRNLEPANVAVNGDVQTGGFFLSRSGNFVAGDVGVFLSGYQIADAYGALFAVDHLSTPAAYLGTIYFSDNSQLTANGSGLTWTSADGTNYTVVTAPAP